MKTKVLSVVCARAGSKGVINKCIAKINNKMVVEYSVEYSLSLGDVVRTVVSTDIEELIEYCEGMNIPYIRRAPELCTDESKIDDALADAIEKDNFRCEYCSLIYGNIPLRYPRLFHEALNFMVENQDYDAVISMQNVEKYHPHWMFDYNERVLPRVRETHFRRQMLSQKMIHDGHTFIFKSQGFYDRYKNMVEYERDYRYSIFGSKTKPQINDEAIIDVDTERDLRLAEALIRCRG
jgi:CMP-N-acetylneuraminic acid synthetase